MTELRYKDNRRDGSTDVEQMQLISLHLLAVLKRVCEEQGIRFWLAYGTLLGAVRSGKFIPWDDDVDVYMMYKDVRKLARIANNVFPKDVIWQDPWCFPRLATTFFARLRDAYSILIEDCGACPRRVTDPLGVPLDIFMLRPVRGKWGLEMLQRIRGPLEWRYRMGRETGPATVMTLIKTWFRGFIYKIVDIAYGLRLLVPVGKRYYIQENVSAIGAKYIYPAEWFDVTRTKLFENESFLVPNDLEGYCEMVFGEGYMTPRKTKSDNHNAVFLSEGLGLNSRSMSFKAES